MLRFISKVVLFFFVVPCYISAALLIILITRDPNKRRLRLCQNIGWFCKYVGMPLIGLDVEYESQQQVDPAKNYLVVCNHLSYTDVLVISAAFPSIFITSVEVKNSFFVGFMSALGGSLFVERRDRSNIDKEIAQIAHCLQSGINVVLFPEATSSNGESVLPFKRSLLKSALDAKVNVLPMCIGFTKFNGQAITPETREKLCYYGDKTFFDHLRTVMGVRSFSAKLRFLKEISTEAVPDRKRVAEIAYDMIVEAYQTIQLPANAIVSQKGEGDGFSPVRA